MVKGKALKYEETNQFVGGRKKEMEEEGTYYAAGIKEEVLINADIRKTTF